MKHAAFVPASSPVALLRLLGGCALEVQGRPADLRYDKVRALLALLALAQGGPLRRERLAEWLWPQAPADVARRNLRHALHVLREALSDAADAVESDRHSIRLVPQALSCDALLQEAAHARWCRGGAPPADAALLEEAAQADGGEFLAGIDVAGSAAWDDWLRDQRAAAAARAADVWRELARLRLAAGMPREALAAARRLLGLDPADEASNRLCMEALAGSQGAEAALAHYEAWRARQHHELGVAPGAQMQALAAQLRERAQAMPALAERRPVTVLCVQQLAGEDESEGAQAAPGFAALLERLRRAGAEGTAQVAVPHEGLAFVYFGLPLSGEDSALVAARLAAELAANAQAQPLALALHCAMVVLEAAGASATGLGPLSNTALRLAGRAEPGQVVASEEAAGWLRRDIARRGESLALSPHSALPGAVLVCARPPGRGARVAGIEQALAGRRAELAQLLRALRAARTAPAAAALVGEAGLGKTRLALEVALRARAGGAVAWLRCSRESATQPLAPLRAWIAGLASIQPSDSATRIAAKLARLERRLDGGQLLSSLFDPLGGGAQPMALRARAGALAELAARMAAQRTLLVVVDDIQWADPSTREVLAHWLQEVRGRVFTLLLARDDADVPTSVEVLRPPRLNDAQARALLLSVQPEHPLRPHETEAALQLAEGLPICLVEAKRHWATGRTHGQLRLPRSLHELLAARLDALSPPLRRLAGHAGVLGHEGGVEALAVLVEQTPAQLNPQLARLAEAGLLHPPEGGRWMFRHQMLQRAAVERLPLPQQAALHARAARELAHALSPARLAHHWEQAGDATHTLAAHARAGQQALAEGAQREALHHFGRVLDLAAQVEPAADVLFAAWNGKGLALAVLEGYSSHAAHGCFVQARALALQHGNAVGVVRATWGLWLSSSDRVGFRGSLLEARYLLQCADALPAGRDREPWICLAHSAMGNNLLWLGRLREAQEHLLATATLAEQPGVRQHIVAELGEAMDLYSLGFLAWIARKRGDATEAAAYLERAFAAAHALNSPPSRALARGMAAIEAMMAGDAQAALPRAQRTLEAAGVGGYELWLGVGLLAQGWAQVRLGQDADVQSLGDAVGAVSKAMPSAVLRFMVPYLDALCHMGQHEQGLQVADEALRLSRQFHDRLELDAIWLLRAHCLQGLGRAHEAQRNRYRAARVRSALLGAAPGAPTRRRSPSPPRRG